MRLRVEQYMNIANIICSTLLISSLENLANCNWQSTKFQQCAWRSNSGWITRNGNDGDNRYHKKDNDVLNGGVGVGRAGNSQGSGKTGGNTNLLAHMIQIMFPIRINCDY